MKDVDERADRNAEVVPHRVQRIVPLSHEVARGGVGAEHALRELVGGAARAVRLDVATPGGFNGFAGTGWPAQFAQDSPQPGEAELWTDVLVETE